MSLYCNWKIKVFKKFTFSSKLIFLFLKTRKQQAAALPDEIQSHFEVSPKIIELYVIHYFLSRLNILKAI